MPNTNFSRHCLHQKGFFPSPPLTLAPFRYRDDKRCLLTMENAQLNAGNRLLWENVNLTLCSGEFTALLGANGVGKTTLFNALLGIVPLSSGHIHKQIPLTIGYVPQLKIFDPKLPIRGRDLVRLGLDGGGYGVDWGGGLLAKILQGFANPPKPVLSKKTKNYLIDQAIDEVGGRHFAHAPLNELSGGEQQRMRIAQALVSEPTLLLLDEPLLSLDASSQAIVSDILAHRKNVHNTAILMISHEIVPILPLLDKVVWLNDKTAKTYLPKDFFAENTVFNIGM